MPLSERVSLQLFAIQRLLAGGDLGKEVPRGEVFSGCRQCRSNGFSSCIRQLVHPRKTSGE
jgi:hypothetical protein